jgi:hypothetical protein
MPSATQYSSSTYSSDVELIPKCCSSLLILSDSIACSQCSAKGVEMRTMMKPSLPSFKYPSIQTFLAIAAGSKLKVHEMGLKMALLNGELEEEVSCTTNEAPQRSSSVQERSSTNLSLWGQSHASSRSCPRMHSNHPQLLLLHSTVHRPTP